MRKNKIIADSNARLEDAWLRALHSIHDPEHKWAAIEELVSKHRDGHTCKVIQRIPGGFNYCFRLRFDGKSDWILRFPLPGSAMYPNQKVEDEAAIMQLLKTRTDIPLPQVVACGQAHIGSIYLGPYIIMEYIEGYSLDDLILTEKGDLRADVEEETLRKIYKQMAKILLQLSSLTFDKIGSPHFEQSELSPSWAILRGPLTMKSNELKRLGGMGSENLSTQAFGSPAQYIHALIEQSLHHLKENPMASESYEEASEDYKALCALQSSLLSFASANDEDRFHLFNDDIRFGNMIVDEQYNILAIIDWEFCYAAPSSFLASPPLWLIGTEPFEWEDTQEYESRLELFLGLLEAGEHAAGLDCHLSTCMRRFWADGTFWFNAAVREPLCLAKTMKHCWRFFPDATPPCDVEKFCKYKMEQRSNFLATQSLAEL